MRWRPGTVPTVVTDAPENDDLDLLERQRRAKAVSRWENEGGGLTATRLEEDTRPTRR